MSGFAGQITQMANTDLFDRDPKSGKLRTGDYVGRPFQLDYDRMHVLVSDARKQTVKGIPQGSFLLAYYDNEREVSEALLLRVLRPSRLPTDGDVISSMIEFYKDNLRTSGADSQLDDVTRYEFSFSGLECRILGTFYRDKSGAPRFGADLENFFSAHNYSVVKPNREVLETIVNFREDGVAGGPTDVEIGRVRYSSSRRFQDQDERVPVYVSATDFIGKRTALFGMTRTGKSNTVKKIIGATVQMSLKAPGVLPARVQPGSTPTVPVEDNLQSFTDEGVPKYPVGQIIFDVNGEYANANLQDAGTAIFDLYVGSTSRYSTVKKPDFRVMKVNFYRDVQAGFELVRSYLRPGLGNYIDSFRAVDFAPPEEENTDAYRSAKTRYDRKVAAYYCCLHRAGFPTPLDFRVKFQGNKDLNALVKTDGSLDPSKGLSLDDATTWFSAVWDAYESNVYFANYKRERGHEWADEDLKALLVFLTRKRQPGGGVNVDGYIRLRAMTDLHTPTQGKSFEVEILEDLRAGRIVIVDLSQGDPEIQTLYSERICRQIFADAMDRFVHSEPNNFVQFYFEEAHNLFPQKEDKDLSQIYNRIAKEGAKLNLGLIYATQEVSSISANILKNTQNWFIAHLNNEDETREIKRYYDFGDFSDSLIRFSASNDKGFVRMKTYSNPFVVPVQVAKFPADEDE